MTARLLTLAVSTTTGRWARATALALGVCAASLHGGAWAASAPVLNLAGLKSSHSYTPSLGESLERIVAKTMPNSPLRADLLAQAFVTLNPQAFGKTAPLRTLGTAALQVPNHNQLMHIALASTSEAQQALATKAAPTPERRENWVRYAGGPIKTPAPADASTDERRHWVRYLGGTLARAFSDSPARAETQAWVQYPSVARAATAPAALPETRIDTSKWVRYVANRIYPQQQFAQLLD
jgi:Tfp pilus assembly protein FimV